MILGFFAGRIRKKAILPVLIIWQVVGLDLRQLGSLGVFLCQVELRSVQERPDGAITNLRILTGLFELERVVLGAKRIVPSSVDMDPVGHLVVVQPKVILLHDCLVKGGSQLVYGVS